MPPSRLESKMSEDAFDPRNDLERQLVELHEGRLDEDAFLAQLPAAEVFMPVKDQSTVGGIQRSAQAHPLVVESEEGMAVLLLFTSPERAKPVLQDFPDFKGGILTEFKWVLDKLDAAHGISLNPGWEIGYDIDPAQVARLMARNPAG
jgi:hypothetical protein